jgi:hypothetical protein
MNKRHQKRIQPKLTIEDYVKAVKIADREMEQSFRPGWTAKVKIHASKKTYNRKANRRIEE